MASYSPLISLHAARSPQDWGHGAAILSEYAASLPTDVALHDFDRELADLAGNYSREGELFLLATVDGDVAGCCALRVLDESIEGNACEMKRLYVRPAYRGFGLGRMLVEALMQRARDFGFSAMFLDTLSDMDAARGLYTSLGFVPTEPYYFNPSPGAHYFRADLDSATSRY